MPANTVQTTDGRFPNEEKEEEAAEEEEGEGEGEEEEGAEEVGEGAVFAGLESLEGMGGACEGVPRTLQ
ncbi:hypothetical protein ACF065_15275 [Streptomyces sp. NPDC015232]|uniref:hypothetical protein n=1 Tax=unclassified Streptomyces TaxID=2593676 RepID=UPI0036F59844